MSLVAPDNDMAVIASLLSIAGAAFMLERTRLGSRLTATVIAILGAMLAANLQLIPHAAPAYGWVFTYVVPVLIPLFLFQADLRRILFESTRTTAAFLLAAAGTVAGVTVAALVLDLNSLAPAATTPPEQREAAIAGLFAATYIGGSVNYAALGEVTGLSRDASFFSAATATDNLFGAGYLAVLALLSGWRWLAGRFAPHDHTATTAAAPTAPISAMSLTLALAVATLLVALSDGLVAWLDLPGWRYVIITTGALAFASLAPGAARRLAGSFELGVCLSLLFFAAIAAGADVDAMVRVAPQLVIMVLIVLAVHASMTLALGRLLGLSLPELITASNAAILGATTAPALAATRGWNNLVTPGVLAGVLGYALGTYAGTLIYRFWGSVF